MTNAALLLISQDKSLRHTIHNLVTPMGWKFESVSQFDKAARLVGNGQVQVVMAHVGRSHDEVRTARLLHELRLLETPATTFVIGDDFDAEIGLSFIKMGAADYIPRPLNLNRLSLLLKLVHVPNPIRQQDADDSVCEVLESATGDESFMFGTSSMREMLNQVRKVAATDATILISGETGTGKTHLARVIHQISPRNDRPFLNVNCGALTQTLIESELFGHQRGAFTGADQDRVGKFALAGDGTLLLDDLDAMPLNVQANLLRTVEERVFEPVGSENTLQFRARLIVASNKSLEVEVAEGRFRSDLYYRLNVVSFHVPPLRKRREEIRDLVQFFLREIAKWHKLEEKQITADALLAIERYDWPGNVRELHNVLERAFILGSDSQITTDLLPGKIRCYDSSDNGSDDGHSVVAGNKLAQARADAELEKLLDVLRRNSDNRTQTALELGVSRTALYKKLHRFGLM